MEQKSRDERIAELLEGAAKDAVGAIKGPSLADIAPVEEEVKAVAPDVEEEETPTGGKKVRIPLSRLTTLTSKVDELEAQLRESATYAERVAALEAQIRANKEDEELPEWWKEAYGDTDVSKQGYKNQQRVMREEMQRVFKEQESQRRTEESERAERVQAIERSFDTQMEELEDSLGRDLTAAQKSELLDIVGEYSPMDGDKYLAYIPVAKAYDIWQKSQTVDQGKQEIARIAGAKSSGGTQTQVSQDRPQWGDWRKRFGA